MNIICNVEIFKSILLISKMCSYPSNHDIDTDTVIDLSLIVMAILGNITAIILYVQEIGGNLYTQLYRV